MIIQRFINKTLGVDVRAYEQNKLIYLNAEDVAFGLGFFKTDEKFSTTCGRNGEKLDDTHVSMTTYISVRWNRINKYLKSFGYTKDVGKDDYIPENLFYRLSMKAKNKAAEKFQIWISDEVVLSIRRFGGYLDSNHPKIREHSKVTRQLFERATRFLAESRYDQLSILHEKPEIAKTMVCGAITNNVNKAVGIEKGKRDEANEVQLINLIRIEN